MTHCRWRWRLMSVNVITIFIQPFWQLVSWQIFVYEAAGCSFQMKGIRKTQYKWKIGGKKRSQKHRTHSQSTGNWVQQLSQLTAAASVKDVFITHHSASMPAHLHRYARRVHGWVENVLDMGVLETFNCEHQMVISWKWCSSQVIHHGDKSSIFGTMALWCHGICSNMVFVLGRPWPVQKSNYKRPPGSGRLFLPILLQQLSPLSPTWGLKSPSRTINEFKGVDVAHIVLLPSATQTTTAPGLKIDTLIYQYCESHSPPFRVHSLCITWRSIALHTTNKG